MQPHLVFFGTGAVLLLSACSDSAGPSVSSLKQALAQAKISLSESIRAGESSVGGTGLKAALLVEAAPVYAVNALGNGTLHDLRVDAVSGAVTSSRSLGASSDPCPGSIPIADAIGIAEAKVRGSAVKVQPDDDDHCLREVQVLSSATLWEVKVARDGGVLEVEKADGDGN